MKSEAGPLILDACCGRRMMWFNKEQDNTIYIDNRKDEKIHPDLLMDFRGLGFKDEVFDLVVFDPPHLKNCGPNSVFAKKFGRLIAETWRSDLQRGFKECWRVLRPRGILIFKWNNHDIKLKTILGLLPVQPLFGQRTCGTGYSQTYWFTFMKLGVSN